MYESQQHFVDLDDSAAANSWLAAGQDRSVDSPLLRRTHDPFSATGAAAPSSNLDRNLFNDLVEIVPLVQSLIVSYYLFIVIIYLSHSLIVCVYLIMYVLNCVKKVFVV